MKRKKLLILTSRYPYPVIGGERLRIYFVCKILSRYFDLSLLSFCDRYSDMEMSVPTDGVFKEIHKVYLPKWRSYLNCLLAAFSSTPLQVAYYRNRLFRKRAQQLMREHDGSLGHLIRVAEYVSDFGVQFLEMTDAISLNYERVRHSKNKTSDIRATIYRVESKRLLRYEREIVDRFSDSFLVSAIDRQHLFGEFPERLGKVHVVSNGVDFAAFPYQFSRAGSTLIFIGNMSSLQNFDAAFYMASEILPLIRGVRSDVRLKLIGRISSEKAKILSAFSGVDVTGEVPSIPDAARGGAVGVCPLRLGAGVQNKILEYMALGLPTVSTERGLEGFQARPGIEISIANDAQGFADAVLLLLDDRSAADRMAKSARGYIETYHSWEAILSPMVEVIKNRLEDRSISVCNTEHEIDAVAEAIAHVR